MYETGPFIFRGLIHSSKRHLGPSFPLSLSSVLITLSGEQEKEGGEEGVAISSTIIHLSLLFSVL